MTKVLIFETDHALAVELRTGLTRLGCVVQVFKEGATGLMAALATPPDIILLSVELPRMNGFSVCNKIKKDPTLQHIPLIILSEQSTPETFAQHRKLKTCAQDYLHKPVAFEELLGRMQRVAPTFFSSPQSGRDGPLSTRGVASDQGAGPSSARRGFGTPPSSESQGPSSYVDRGPISSRRTMPRQKRPSSTHYPLDDAPPPSRPSGRPNSPITPVVDGAMRGPVRVGDLGEQSTLPELSFAERRQHVTLARKTQPRMQVFAAQDAEPGEAAAAAETGAGSGAISGSHESFQLRELLRRKDKEVVGLREQLQARDRELLDLRDEHLARDRSSTGLDDRVVLLERRIAELVKQNEALAAQKGLDKKRLQDVRAGAKRVAQQLNNRAVELRDVKQTHSQQILQLERAHAESMRRLEVNYRSNLNQNESASQKESDALQHQLTSMQGQLQAASDAIAIRDETIDNERARSQQFEQDLQKASDALVGASSGADEKQAEAETLREDLNVLFREREEEARRRMASDERCQQLEEKLDRLRSQASALAEDRDRAVHDAERARLERNGVVAERDAVVAERNAAAANRAASEREKASLSSETNALRHQAQAALAERHAIEAERDAAIAECDAGIEERSALESQMRAAVSECDALSKAVGQERERNGCLQEQVQQMQAQLSQVERESAGWQEERRELESEHKAALQQAQRNYQGELLQKLAEASEDAEKQAKGLREQLEARVKEYDELARSNEELVGQLTSVKRQRQSALQKIERSERQWRKDRQALRSAGEALALIANRVDSASEVDHGES